MLRLVFFCSCIVFLQGCQLVLALIDSRYGSYEAFIAQTADSISEETQAYLDELSESGGGLYNLAGGEIDVEDDNLDITLMAIPKPGFRFAQWQAGEGFLYANATDTLIDFNTAGLSSPAWLDFLMNSDQSFFAGAEFVAMPAQERDEDPLELCMPYRAVTPGSVTTTRETQVSSEGGLLNIETRSSVSSFVQVGPHEAMVELKSTRIEMDEAFNEVRTVLSRQRISVAWPGEGIEAPGIRLLFERIDTIPLEGDRRVNVVRYPGGLLVYPADLSAQSDPVESIVQAQSYFGDRSPQSNADFHEFGIHRTMSHRPSNDELMLIGADGSVEAANCRMFVSETQSIGTEAIFLREDQTFL
ncbi:MAG: hypothetical protein AAGI44_14255, partial [Pseudomonadota bacterium]